MHNARASHLRSSAFTASTLLICALAVVSFIVNVAHAAPTAQVVTQSARPTAAQTPAHAAPLVRRTTRRELRRTGYGGALSILGAPAGNIRVEAWSRPETEIVAEIEMRGETEEDLARLAAVNTFVLDGDATRLNLVTVGTHDRKHLRRVARDFPKRLIGAEWRIDYTVRVPAVYDVEIFAGRGTVSVANVEGALRINLAEGDLTLTLAGGDASATVARGNVKLTTDARSWRGRGIDLRLGQGDLIAELPADFSADIDARILQSGQLENSFGEPTPFEVAAQPAPAARRLQGRFGGGGAAFTFSVASGDIRLLRRTVAK